METTKTTSPYTQFNAKYYNNLKRISLSKAEEYRKSVTKSKKDTIDLGKIHAERTKSGKDQQKMPSEREIRGITKEETKQPEEKDSIDLGKQLEKKGSTWVQQPKDEEWTKKNKQIDQGKTAAEIAHEEWLTDEERQATPDNPKDVSELLDDVEAEQPDPTQNPVEPGKDVQEPDPEYDIDRDKGIEQLEYPEQTITNKGEHSVQNEQKE